MRKMTFDNRRKDLVSGILKYHKQNGETQGGIFENELETRKMLRKTGEELYDLLIRFQKAKGCNTQKAEQAFAKVLENKDAYCIPMLAITGTDLKEMGVPQGKEIGLTLNKLLDMVIEDPSLNKKETLTKIIRGEK